MTTRELNVLCCFVGIEIGIALKSTNHWAWAYVVVLAMWLIVYADHWWPRWHRWRHKHPELRYVPVFMPEGARFYCGHCGATAHAVDHDHDKMPYWWDVVCEACGRPSRVWLLTHFGPSVVVPMRSFKGFCRAQLHILRWRVVNWAWNRVEAFSRKLEAACYQRRTRRWS